MSEQPHRRRPRQALPPAPEGPRPDPRLRGAAGRRRAGRVREPRAAAAAAQGAGEGRLRRRGTRRSPPSWSTGRCAGRARTTRSSPPASTGRCARSTRRCSTCSSLGAHQLLGHAHPHARRRLRQRRAGPGGARRRAGQVRQRRAAQDRRSTTSTAGWSGSPRPTTRTPRTTSPSCTRIRAGSSPRCGTPSAAAAPGSRTCWRPTTSGPRSPSSPGPAGPPPTNCSTPGGGRAAGPLVAVRRAARRGRRARRHRRRTGGPGRRAGRGQPARRARPRQRARSTGPTRAGSTAAPGPGGKAALLAALAAERGAVAARLREAAAPGPAGRAGAGRQPRPVPGHRRRRHPAAVAARHLRPGADGRAVHRPRRAAPPPRGPLAAPPRGPGRASRRSSAGCCARRWSAVRVGGVVGYATCSPHLAETRAVVDDVLKQPRRRPPSSIDARPLLPGVPALGDGPDVQLWPHLHGTDAMYLALLRRTA